jgi:superfamily II DNA or RNA helicase
MSRRDERQVEFANKWLETKWGIIYAAPRTGKCRIAYIILKEFIVNANILIVYPDNKIKKSWEDEFKIMNYKNPNIVFTTYLSLGKHMKAWDLIICDELHTLSPNQIEVLKEFPNFKTYSNVLGLSGTISKETAKTLLYDLKLPIVAEYSIEQAIAEGVVTDYEINVIKVNLDSVVKQNFKGKFKTEKQQFDNISWVIDKLEKEGKDSFFMKLARMRVIQNSLAKLNKTKLLLSMNSGKRILVFTGNTTIADKLEIPSFHSKSIDKDVFDAFASGNGNHLAVCKIGSTGKTFLPLDHVIINFTDSNSQNLTQRINRCLGLEYSNPEKKAKIYLISSNESIEEKWVKSALSMFDNTKIKYV